MNPYSGSVYETLDEAYAAGEKRENLVEIVGTPQQVRTISKAIQHGNATAKRRAKNKQARRSRRARR